MRSKSSHNYPVIVAAAVAAFALILPTAAAADADQATATATPTTQPKSRSYPPYPKIVGLSIGDAAPDFKLPRVAAVNKAPCRLSAFIRVHLPAGRQVRG